MSDLCYFEGADAWVGDRERFDAVTLPLLRKHGKAIGKAAGAGDNDARSVMRDYEMLRRSFDPVFHEKLTHSLNRWVGKQPAGGTP